MDVKELAENLGLEESEFLEIMELFIEATASDLGRLESAIVGGDARQAVEAAHSIKGAAGNLGLNEIYEIAAALEKKAGKSSLEGATEAVKTIREKCNEVAENFRKVE
jgi:HPt (histidine-containing phosphotransfer) domain-containing protein